MVIFSYTSSCTSRSFAVGVLAPPITTRTATERYVPATIATQPAVHSVDVHYRIPTFEPVLGNAPGCQRDAPMIASDYLYGSSTCSSGTVQSDFVKDYCPFFFSIAGLHCFFS
jgi:hypothetical protein